MATENTLDPTLLAKLNAALCIPPRKKCGSLASRLITAIKDAQANGTDVPNGTLEAARRLLKRHHYTLPELAAKAKREEAMKTKADLVIALAAKKTRVHKD